MGDEIKKDLKNLARHTENRLAQSLLRWKRRREGEEEPDEERIRQESERVTESANRILAKRGRRVWDELKKAYRAPDKGEGGTD